MFLLSTVGQHHWLGSQLWRGRAIHCYKQAFLIFTWIFFIITQTFGPLNSRLWLVCILLTNMHLLRQEPLVAFLSCSSSEVTDAEAPFPHVRRTQASRVWMKRPLQWPLRHVMLWQACSLICDTADVVPHSLPTSLLAAFGEGSPGWVSHLIFPMRLDLHQEKKTWTEGAEEHTHFDPPCQQPGLCKQSWAQQLFRLLQKDVPELTGERLWTLSPGTLLTLTEEKQQIAEWWQRYKLLQLFSQWM